MKIRNLSVMTQAVLASVWLGFSSQTASAELPSWRYQDFEDWPVTSTIVTQTNDHWVVEDGRLMRYGEDADDNAPYLLNAIGPNVRSPLLTNGVGTVYFWAYKAPVRPPVTVGVQTSTNGIDGWVLEGIHVVEAGAGGAPVYYSTKINKYEDVFVRIVRLDEDTNYNEAHYVRIDNIALSPAPAYVDMDWKLFEPGYPSAKQEVTVRARITDSSAADSATNRQVEVYYRWQAEGQDTWTDFTPTNMVPVGGDLYEGIVPAHNAGTIQYYYKCSYDGYYYTGPTGFVEERSPAYLGGAGQLQQTVPTSFFSYDIRVFNSSYGSLEVDADLESYSTPMSLMGDHLWQAMINVSAITNLNISLIGKAYYVSGAEEYSDMQVNWGDDDPEFPYPPLAGHVETDAPPIQLLFEYDGFLMIRLNTTNGEYSVKRAAYQDFNEWQASPSYFEESLGLYAVQTFLNDFDDWPLDVVTEDMKAIDNFQAETQDDEDYQASTFQTMAGWAATAARRISDRADLEENDTERNRSLMLRPGFGSVQNLTDSLVQSGLDSFKFSYRAGLDDDHLTYRKLFSLDWEDYIIRAKVGAQSMSAANPSVSILSHYQDAANYFELRLKQVRNPDPDHTTEENWLRGEYWINKNGDLSLLYTSPTLINKRLTDGPWDVEFTVDNQGTYTRLTATFDGTAIGTYDASSTERFEGPGTIGFHSRDAVIQVDQVTNVQNLDASPVTLLALRDFSSDGQLAEWYLAPDNGSPRWQRVNNRLSRPLNAQTFYVDQQKSIDDDPSIDPTEWVQASILQANSLSFQPTEVVLHNWEQTFVRIRQGSGDWAVVVDNLEIAPWRGRNHEQDGWSVTEAWIASAGGGDHVLELDRSRAKDGAEVPVEERAVQVLRTPLLTNGLGTISFSYDSSGTSVFAIERTIPGDLTAWVTLNTVTNMNAENVSYFLPVRTNMVGYLRVRHTSASDDDAVLTLNDLRVRDYPASGDTTWKGYNVLISNSDAIYELPEKTFDGFSCFLNNDKEEGTAPNETFDEDSPYIQSPAVGTGIGEIAFWARVWDASDPTPGEIVLEKASSSTSTNWVEFARQSISNGAYAYFQWEFFDQDSKVLRIYAETNNRQRVAIDNVLVTEPVRAGFDIVDVTLDPVQPLYTNTVTVSARLDRFLMNPTEIKVYLRYKLGTNVWGLNDWVEYNYTGQIPMVEVASRQYETQFPIPEQAIDTVVQYAVVATYEGPNAVDLVTQLEFEYPQWYEPVDLNDLYEGWSPYYFVYSCPPETVWINEVNYRARSGEDDYEFVEMVGPGGASVAGWSLALVSNAAPYGAYDTYTLDAGTEFENTTNGWGFLVVGDAGVPGVVKVFSPPGTIHMDPSYGGGIVLTRSTGAWEHRVAYGGNRDDLVNEEGFDDAGYKNPFYAVNRSLGLVNSTTGGTSRADFQWAQASTGNESPGAVNADQDILEIDPFTPGDLPELASVTIESFQFVGGKIQIFASGTNDWQGVPQYRTNLFVGDWQALETFDSIYQNGQFVIEFDLPSSGNAYYYRITAEPAE